jgi:hypothetical protein
MNVDADQKTVGRPVRSSTPIPSNATKSARRASGSSFVAVKSHQLLDVIQKASDAGVRQIL